MSKQVIVDGTTWNVSDFAAYRTLFAQVHGRDTTISDEKLISIVNTTQETEENPADWPALFLAAEQTLSTDKPVEPAKPVVINASTSEHTHALDMAALIDDSIDSEVRANRGKKEDLERGPLKLRDKLLLRYGAEKLNDFPVPGSGKGEHDLPPGANGRLDKYKVKSGGETVSSSFYKDLFGATPFGKEIDAETKALKAVKNKEGVQAGNPFTKWEGQPIKLDAEIKLRNARFNNGVAQYANALKLHFALIEAENYPGVNFTIDRDNSRAPYAIQNKHALGKFEMFSNTSLPKLDFRKAKDKATVNGTIDPTKAYDALMETKKREKEATPAIAVENVEHAEEAEAGLATFYGGDTKAAVGRRSDLLKLLVDVDKNAHRILSIGDVVLAYDDFWSKGGEKAYYTLKRKLAEAARSESAAREAAA